MVNEFLTLATCSALALLVPGIAADHVHHPAAAHDLAVLADLFDGRTNLHCDSSSASGPALAITEQVRLLEKTRVVMRHHVRLKLRHEIHHDHHDDQQRRATELERHALR